MEALVAEDDNRNRNVALIGTILFHAIILTLLFFYIIRTPIPPYPEMPKPEIELDFGNGVNGTGNVEANNMGTNPNPDNKAKSSSEKATANPSTAPLSNDGEDPNIKTAHKVVKNAKVDTTTTQQQHVSVDLANAMNKFKHSKGNPGGDGNSGEPGNAGNPNGTQPGESNGDGGNIKFTLKNRRLVTPPSINANSQDQGTVVVAILVDQSGKVIKANPGAKGSTTTSPVLYQKAKEAALATKFSSSPDGTPQQEGTMSIIFVIQ
jgi:protein TonB